MTPATRSTSSDRKSTRLNSSHVEISYAVFCLKKKKTDSQLRPWRLQLEAAQTVCPFDAAVARLPARPPLLGARHGLERVPGLRVRSRHPRRPDLPPPPPGERSRSRRG